MFHREDADFSDEWRQVNMILHSVDVEVLGWEKLRFLIAGRIPVKIVKSLEDDPRVSMI